MLLQGAGPQVQPAPAGGAFTVDGAEFDGTNDSMSRGGSLTGASDARKWTTHFWWNASAPQGAQIIFNNANGSTFLGFGASGELQVDVLPEDFSAEFFFQTDDPLPTDDAWYSIYVYVDTDAGAGAKTGLVYVDGAPAATTVLADGDAAFDMDFTDTDWNFGLNPFAPSVIAARFAEFWSGFGADLPPTVGANILKFRTAGGKPEDLGTNGDTPTGSQPTVYFHLDDAEAPANFALNRGAGGNFSITGTLTTASTSPSD